MALIGRRACGYSLIRPLVAGCAQEQIPFGSPFSLSTAEWLIKGEDL
jgi:hypothetical protein